MSATYANPRQVLHRAAEEAPEPVVQAIADALTARESSAADLMVVLRFRRDGGASSEVFTATRQDEAPARPISLLEALQANDDLYQDALRRGRDAKRELLAAEGGVLTGAQVAELLGLSRQAVDKRRRTGRLLAVETGKREFAYPAWQFTDNGVLPGLEEVLEDLSDHDPWMQLIFMLSPDSWLDDQMPLHVLRCGQIDRVRRAAQMLGEHGAP